MQKGHDQKHWDKIGNSYNAFWESKAKQELSKKELGFINKYLKKTKNQYILDIGVGSGRIIENYLASPKVKGIYGIDWASSMVNFCRNKFKNKKEIQEIAVCNISKEQFPFKNKFDFVSAIRVLKYNQNWQEVIGKAVNSLSSNGIFVFTMPNKNSFLRFTKPETSIYSTNKTELERVIQQQKGEIIQITSFMKLPDVFYDISDNKLYVSILLWLEQVLKIILGVTFLSRIFFIAVRKRSDS
ncbi:class I SAM-dependent methyltransferase [Candidatus Daviesbacteria bacterium]|nr:class I SAM-dependent methyltransferase [Candidatus Daviesbacteria bacterium]